MVRRISSLSAGDTGSISYLYLLSVTRWRDVTTKVLPLTSQTKLTLTITLTLNLTLTLLNPNIPNL